MQRCRSCEMLSGISVVRLGGIMLVSCVVSVSSYNLVMLAQELLPELLYFRFELKTHRDSVLSVKNCSEILLVFPAAQLTGTV